MTLLPFEVEFFLLTGIKPKTPQLQKVIIMSVWCFLIKVRVVLKNACPERLHGIVQLLLATYISSMEKNIV